VISSPSDGLLGFGARADGNLFGHPSFSKKEMSLAISEQS
jgi:hypothetical protein